MFHKTTVTEIKYRTTYEEQCSGGDVYNYQLCRPTQVKRCEESEREKCRYRAGIRGGPQVA